MPCPRFRCPFPLNKTFSKNSIIPGDITFSDIWTKVEVGKLDGHQKRIPATIVDFPFYDPDKSRVRS